jgi:hypothetical protein
MFSLLLAVFIYTVAFGIDYLFYVKQKSTYNYVSRRTFCIFISAQLVTIYAFYPMFKPFLAHIGSELLFMGVLTTLLLFFTYSLVTDRILVCNISSRTERCLTPGYVLVKGSEVVLQQILYLAVALSLAPLFTSGVYAYIIFILILLIMHTTLVLSCGRNVTKRLTFGLLVISAPIFYVFTELQAFWPAVYLHSLMYVFYWLTFADFDIEPQE